MQPAAGSRRSDVSWSLNPVVPLIAALLRSLAGRLDGKLEAAFKQFDKDESGALDLEELQLAYAEAGMQISDAKLAKCIKLLDTNGDGVIDRAEAA